MIPFKGAYFDVKLRNFFPFNQVAFLATLLFRHRSFRLPEEIGISRSGPPQRSILLRRKNVDLTGTVAGKKCASQTQSDV